MKQLDPKAVWLFTISLILRWFILIIFISVWAALFLSGQGDGDSAGGSAFFRWLWLIVPVLLLVCYGWARLSYRYYRYDLTDDGFRKELGVIYKQYVTIPYDRIQNVDIYRGILARILGLSDLNIQTAGSSAVMNQHGGAGFGAEGRLPALSREVAEQLRDELIRRARQLKSQGL